MTLTFFFGKKILFCWRHTFRHKNSHLWNTAITSLEHIRLIFGTQHAGRVVMSLITTLLLFLSDDENGTAVAQVRIKIHKNGKWRHHCWIIR